MCDVRVLVITLISCGPVSPAMAQSLTYERDIRPIFRAHCFDCHGAIEKLEGGLDLRLVRSMTKGGESGPAIVPGKSEESYLLGRVENGEMPPGEGKVSAEEIKTIKRWIAEGAKPTGRNPNNLAPAWGSPPRNAVFGRSSRSGVLRFLLSSSFRKEDRVRTPIDALVQASPQFQGFAADADRRTLVVRAYLDLIGLPPSPEEIQKWLADSQEDWYDRLLAELLDSPHYGERWARHWLDVAGYADSEGYTATDADRPWAWKYRDYCVRSLNADKPFDRFITEQLAGDELAGPRNGDLTPEQIELLTATGFLRMAADGTGHGANTPEGRNQVVTDTLKIVGTSLLGLSIQCAQCHDHRYDPIPQTDYYAMRAVFEPALNWQSWKTPQERLVSLYTEADRQQANQIEGEAQKVAAEKAQKQTEYINQALEMELAKFEEPLRGQLREAYQSPNDKRTAEQNAAFEEASQRQHHTGSLVPILAECGGGTEKIRSENERDPCDETAGGVYSALSEPQSPVPETKLFHRGDHQQPKQMVKPAALSVTVPEGKNPEFPLDEASRPTSGRRLAFARWLTGLDNPLFARVIVNRVWMHHFGKGLVATPADLGKLGSRPSHPELLDYLADEFIQSGWSLKKLHRLILTSTVWRQVRDPKSPFRPSLLRLDAEILRDRMLAVTGQLDRTPYGRPLNIKEDDTGQVIVEGEQTRRSLYIRQQRSRPVAMLQTFDAPVMETNCEIRANSTVATQSLILLNGEFILNQAARLAERAAKEAIALPQDQLTGLPPLPSLPGSEWEYGFGSFDKEQNRTRDFTTLGHWTGSQWQAGANLPDPKWGWVLLHAQGGHPDIPGRAVIRRWTASQEETLGIQGKLSHGSPSGDGVRSRVVSSRLGQVGEWNIHNGAIETPVARLEVKPGDTIDFITDCVENQNADSFLWPVTMTSTLPGKPKRIFATVESFHGPLESAESLPGQIVRAWQLAYCREPSREELNLAVGFLAKQMALLQFSPEFLPKGRTASMQALTNLCQALLSSNEFLYVE